MNWKQYLTIFLIAFIGMCAVIRVDNQCLEHTGEGGKAGLSVSRTQEGNMAFQFFGLEGEIGL